MLRLARLLAIPGLVVALAAGAILLSVVGLPDDPPPGDADLIVDSPEIPHAENGYVALHEALERGEDFPSAARRALELPFFQCPRFEVWENSYGLTLSWYDLRTSFERSIEAAEGAGNHAAAFEAGLQAVQVGSRIEAQGGLDVYFGIALQQSGREAIRRVLAGLPLSAEDLVGAAAMLTRGESTQNRRVRQYRIAYTQAARLVDAVASGQVNVDQFAWWGRPRSIEGALKDAARSLEHAEARKRPNRMKGRLAESTRRAIERAGLTEAERARMGTGLGRRKSVFPWLQSEDENFVRMFADGALEAAATAVLLALRAHQLESGSLPESLADLVPRYLECVPADPYDGEPLRYSRAKKVVYSVGEDFTDQGGGEKDERGRWVPHRDLEPTFAIEF